MVGSDKSDTRRSRSERRLYSMSERSGEVVAELLRRTIVGLCRPKPKPEKIEPTPKFEEYSIPESLFNSILLP